MTSAAARYDGHSEWYDEHFGSGHRPAEELAFLREALGTGHGQPCLDLACGTGLWAEPIAAAGYRVAGLDISADQLRFARRRHVAVARAPDRRTPGRQLLDVGRKIDGQPGLFDRTGRGSRPGNRQARGGYGAISASVSGSMAASLAVRSAFRS